MRAPSPHYLAMTRAHLTFSERGEKGFWSTYFACLMLAFVSRENTNVWPPHMYALRIEGGLPVCPGRRAALGRVIKWKCGRLGQQTHSAPTYFHH